VEGEEARKNVLCNYYLSTELIGLLEEKRRCGAMCVKETMWL
jgi:hypothetical protein